MKTRTRIILIVVAGLLAALLAAGLGLYFQAGRVPEDYTPLMLTPAQQEQARQAMMQRLSQFVSLAGEIGSWDPRQVGRGGGPPAQEATFVISQDEINQWLAAAAQPYESRLAAAGLRRAAIAFGHDRLTFYSFQEKYAKVLGVDVSFHFDDEGWMTLRIDGARIGLLPIPDSAFETRKAELIGHLQEQLRRVGSAAPSSAAEPAELANQSAQALAGALEGRPIRLDIRQHFGNVRIRRIHLEKGACTLEVVPLDRRPG